MEQDTKTFLEQFEKQILGMIDAMEQRLEQKIESYMERSLSNHKENSSRHADFRTDIKQIYGRIELIEKSDIALELRVSNLEHDQIEKKQDSKFKWETVAGIGGLIVAGIALFYRG